MLLFDVTDNAIDMFVNERDYSTKEIGKHEHVRIWLNYSTAQKWRIEIHIGNMNDYSNNNYFLGKMRMCIPIPYSN